jgi:hypothetical protein
MSAADGTIFSSSWFALERPAFEKLAAQSDKTLTVLLLAGAFTVAAIALLTPGRPVLKAIVLAYIVLP